MAKMVDIYIYITIVNWGYFMVYKPTNITYGKNGRYNELVFMGIIMVYTPTYNWRGPSGPSCIISPDCMCG